MIRLCNVCVNYKNQKVTLPNLQINKGEIIGLSGKSGSGKSTTAMVLAGFIPPSHGEIEVPTLTSNRANPVQWVGQHPELAFNPKWTLFRSLKESFLNTDFLSQLDDFSIESTWLSRYPSELSGGQLQRVALLRALIPSTHYLLCDEITAQLDPLTQHAIWETLLILSKRHKIGLLIISHDLTLLHKLCHNIVTMD